MLGNVVLSLAPRVTNMPKTRAAIALAPDYEEPARALPGSASPKEDNVLHTIGDLSREFDVTLRALRFYEDKGLLSPIRDGMTRLYSQKDREHLKLILKGKRLGFTLVEISEMIANHGDGKAPRLTLSEKTLSEQIAHLEKQRQEIDEALVELRRSYEGLSRRSLD
jgi:DNA-binding transcriptional MerR regulator